MLEHYDELTDQVNFSLSLKNISQIADNSKRLDENQRELKRQIKLIEDNKKSILLNKEKKSMKIVLQTILTIPV